MPDDEKPKQLPHVREFTTAAGRYSISLISMGFEARRNGESITRCPYGKDDPDGVCWWTLGWHRCDRIEVAQGKPSLWKPKKK
jgi:hypothetical protein